MNKTPESKIQRLAREVIKTLMAQAKQWNPRDAERQLCMRVRLGTAVVRFITAGTRIQILRRSESVIKSGYESPRFGVFV